MIKRLFYFLIIISLFLFVYFNDGKKEEIKLIYIIDADTLKISLRDEAVTVRLIGMDAPEINHPDKSRNKKEGIEARKFLSSVINVNSILYLEYDEERYDKYNRLLAHVFHGEELLSERLIREGYARRMHIYPNSKYQDILKKAEQEAKKEEKNFWSTIWKKD